MPMKAMVYKTLSTVGASKFHDGAVLNGSVLTRLSMTYLRTYLSGCSGGRALTFPCSFCIKMPILHRLACFRDDVVFLVFLYQVRS